MLSLGVLESYKGVSQDGVSLGLSVDNRLGRGQEWSQGNLGAIAGVWAIAVRMDKFRRHLAIRTSSVR